MGWAPTHAKSPAFLPRPGSHGATTARLKDSRGNLIWTVFAKPASEQDQEEISKAVEADLAAIMTALNSEPGLSLAGIARTLGWLTPQGLPNKSKAQRRIRLLEKKKLVERDGERLEITDKGKKWLGKQGKSNEPAPKDGPNLVPVKS